MNVAFAGTPEFAQQALAALLDHGFTIPMVLTQPDRPAGRGMKLHPSPVKRCALDADIPVYQPVSLRKGDDGAQAIATLQTCCDGGPPDVLVVAAYGLILPQAVLDIPKRGCLNIHASLLPRWRGAAPIHRAIQAGDATTGITIMQMDAGLDTGDMLLIHTCDIHPEDTTATLHDRLAMLGGQAIVEALQRLQTTGLTRSPQPTEGITYAHKIAKEEAALDWTLSAKELARTIRAFDPFPGGVAEVVSVSLKNNNSDLSIDPAVRITLKLWSAVDLSVQASLTHTVPGQIIDISASGIDVMCGQGVLRLTQIQKPGGKRIHVSEAWRQLGLHIGDCLRRPGT